MSGRFLRVGLAAMLAWSGVGMASWNITAAAQTARDARLDPVLQQAAAGIAGAFRLSSADGERHCDLTLEMRTAATGLAVAFDRAACAGIAFMKQVVAWTPDMSGAVRLLNAQGGTVTEFSTADGGSFETLREGDGVYFLVPPSTSDAVEVTEKAVMGEWLLSRQANPPICRWTLTDIREMQGGYLVRSDADCNASLARFAAVRWELSGGNIVIHGADGSKIRFARQEDGSWMRIPERNNPLIMTRP